MKKIRYNFIFMELVIAMVLVAVALFPLAYSYHLQARRLKALYYRAVAEQYLDGCREELYAGTWRNYPIGKSVLTPDVAAMRQLAKRSETTLEIKQLGPKRRKIILRWQCDFPGCGKIIKQAVVEK